MKQRFLWLGSALLAVALLLTACPSGSTVKKGDLAVTVSPAGVVWTLSGAADTHTGSETLKDLAPGDYTVSGSLTGYVSGTATATVKDGETATASLTLEKKVVAPTVGTLGITVSPADALVSVTGPDGYSSTFKGSKSISDLQPGTYTVSAENAGYVSDSKTQEVTAGNTSTLSLSLNEVVVKPVASVSISKFWDANDYWGDKKYPYETVDEESNDKIVKLLVAQTEESICFVVTALDSDNEPVPGAEVSVDLTGLSVATVAVIKGCAANQTDPNAISTAAATTSGITNANGEAFFTLFATFSGAPFTQTFQQPDAKVVVSATNDGERSALDEFKVWFFNIAHLHHWDKDINKDVPTKTRWGSDLGFGKTPNIRENVFVKDASDGNVHTFQTRIWRKQPNNYMPHGLSTIGGSMKYTLDDTSRVEFTSCDNLVSASVCLDSDGVIGIKPKNSETQESIADTPIEVEVSAVLTINIRYGDAKNQYYSFKLKSYKFKKRWIAGFLTINKRIDHHVVTWKGSSHTLGQTGTLDDPWIATYTITIENKGTRDAKNVTVTDALQPELGYKTGSAKGPGGTVNYDSVLHELTWTLADLPAGETKEFTFSVFARQKPGFCWDSGAYYYGKDSVQTGRPPQPGSIVAVGANNKQCENPYSDPYNAINGEYKDDVTVEADGVDPIDYVPGNDDVILYVVRPLFKLDKYIKLPGGARGNFIQVDEDENVEFGFEVQSVNRGGPTSGGLFGTNEAAYKALEAKYTSYTNTAGQQVNDFGPGHDQADMKWANPYGSTLVLVDWFDEGLDHDAGGVLSPPKKVSLGSHALLNYKESAFKNSKLAVTAAEPTFDRGSDVEPDGTDDGLDGVIDGWLNCAYLEAQNLNQPRHDHAVSAGPFWDWWDAQPGDVDHPWHNPDNMHQIMAVAVGNPPRTIAAEPVGFSPNDGNVHAGPPAYGPFNGNPNHPGYSGNAANHPTAGVIGDLEDCVVVYVAPTILTKILAQSTVNEHQPASGLSASAFAQAPDTPAVNAGELYWYYFLVENVGTDVVNLIEFDTLLTTNTAGSALTGNYRVMTAPTNTSVTYPNYAWSDVVVTTTPTLPLSLDFNIYNGLPAGYSLLYAVEARAGVAGTNSIDAQISGNDAAQVFTPLTEHTTIQ